MEGDQTPFLIPERGFLFPEILVQRIGSEKGVRMILRLLVTALFVLACGSAGAQDKPSLKDQKEKISYIIGMDIGMNFKKQSVDIDPDLVARGIKDGVSGAKPLLSEQEAREVMASFEKEMRAKQEAAQKVAGEKNKKQGEAFLAENKKKEGVKTLPSGLQYKVIKAGTGKKPAATDTVTTHYKGTLIDGTEFDSSYKRGKPATFPVGGVIPGWTEALQLMEEGAKWQLFIPPNLAYAERGAGQVIGPHTTLIFEVELISIQEKK
ncbi:MAG: FKBP-type peptidyl-prolyl cis-trans isomerase [Deltaproteobacteria bacterium]|nr:FKBP-type peptidyl-prolyl cis-trans isomerase [Deltaproteobacteria bacterium]